MMNMDYEKFGLSDIEAGQRRQERYEYYLVALTFTTLAFSVQTATNTGVPIITMFEVGAWLSLLASGLLALTRMYYLPVIFGYSAEISSLSANIQDAIELEKNGHTHMRAENGGHGSIEEYISIQRTAISKRNIRSAKAVKKITMLNIAHRILFILGFILLIISRGLLLAW